MICSPARHLKSLTRSTIHIGGGMTDASGGLINIDNMPMMGGLGVAGNMTSGGIPSYMMGAGWHGPNGYYGMKLTFRTS
jgi:hypothetical protein